ncbi:pyrimidine-nucleoside phosphorylase [Effusibacillus dendaii]|uniref:Pyrimidine-nucleoside phosphorylase n=1 Tax=Effusibacillus dendaii TaxID=2743772 RepID=A0A7I8DBC9_9BACL|nr:pyrimidine-nucleoside phosphorylase [Effusibacillus dendaii]BCJ85820.1 pyrimidine-nucleoside phosphorylase [Effusibacillus dendaii]
MRMYDLIRKKRDGGELSKPEIEFIVNGYTNGSLPDYQMSAFTMAVFFRGMTARETADLTRAMANSGDTVDLSAIKGIKVDKHSTGGVGDTTTLVLAPLVASIGVPVAKMSGHGLGHTGGTIDKLQSIPGFSVELSERQFVQNVNQIGLALTGQTGDVAPADKKLYALRDVTATVDSIPLIASSVMSKKLAAGADAIVLDVKTGEGAFMKTLDESFVLAKAMVEIGTELGRQTIAVVSDMNQPLGLAVGNALEVKEAIDTLQGHGPADLTELCLELGAHMTVLARKASDPETAKQRLRDQICSGAAVAKLKQFIAAQGGDASVVDRPEMLPQAAKTVVFKSETDGFISYINAETIGTCAMLLGAGREQKDSAIDLAVGIVLQKKIGDQVATGDPLAVLHLNDDARLPGVISLLRESFEISPVPVPKPPLIYGVVTREGIERFY